MPNAVAVSATAFAQPTVAVKPRDQIRHRGVEAGLKRGPRVRNQDEALHDRVSGIEGEGLLEAVIGRQRENPVEERAAAKREQVLCLHESQDVLAGGTDVTALERMRPEPMGAAASAEDDRAQRKSLESEAAVVRTPPVERLAVHPRAEPKRAIPAGRVAQGIVRDVMEEDRDAAPAFDPRSNR
jgi:hypothetical protein